MVQEDGVIRDERSGCDLCDWESRSRHQCLKWFDVAGWQAL